MTALLPNDGDAVIPITKNRPIFRDRTRECRLSIRVKREKAQNDK